MNKLFVVSTPIGNLEDITIRAIKTLLTVPVIACEDTRRTGQLLKILEVRYSQYLSPNPSPNLGEGKRRYISVRDWNEVTQVEQVLKILQESDVALVSDAGTPLISDPGYKLVNVIRAAGFEVIPIPGVSALTTALSGAGLPTNKVVFWGFWNDKYILDPTATNVFYESPVRVKNTVQKLMTLYPQAEIVIANELTKIHEKFLKPGDIDEIKGEVTVLIKLEV